MFTKDEFEQWCSKLGFSDRTIEVISRIRESEPSRKVGGGRKNMVGSFPSRIMGKTLQFESHKVELPLLHQKEHDDSVKEVYDQPPQIKISFKSAKGKVVAIYHTPDYFVLYEDKAGWEECKTEEELKQLSQDSPNRYVLIDGVWHCPPGEEYAKQFGLYYWVKSSAEINWILQRNIEFIEDYLFDAKTSVLLETTNKILSLVRSEPGILLLELLRTNCVEVDDIYYMIARGEIFVDLEQELLSEPDFTHVFIDKQTALAYKTLTTRRNIPLFTDHTIEVAPGNKIIWDGNSWVIANLGEMMISLSSEEGKIVEIAKEQFFNMVCDRRIKGEVSEIIKVIDTSLMSRIAEASEQEIKIANYRYEIILPVLEGLSIKDINEGKATRRTIRNWVNSYKQAEQQYGSGYIGLIPSIKKRGNRVQHLPDETLECVNTFLGENETVRDQSIKVLYGKLDSICKIKGIDVPSPKTFSKIIKSRPRYQRIMRTQGSRAAYEQEEFYWELEMTTPRHGERAFHIAHLDHTEVDLEIAHSKTRRKLGKAWITIMMDAYTRRVLAFFITFNAPSYRSDMMVIRECVRRFNRLPQIIITDNGRDFKSTYFESLFAFYGVTLKRRPPHKARFGSVGERLFGTVMHQLIHNLMGNTKIMKNVRQVTKSVNPKNHVVWTLPALYELLKEYLYEFYDTNEHSALGESPREAFERSVAISGKRKFRFIPYDDEFKIMTLPVVKRNNGTSLVDLQRGVKVQYFYYYCKDFDKPGVAGTRVLTRFDPWDISTVYCYVFGHWAKCYSQYYSILKGKTENEILIASQELLGQKQNNSRKAKVSARELADFISRAEQTEEYLKQSLCDEEMSTQLYVINGGLNSSSNDEVEEIHEPNFDLDEELYFDADED